MIALLALPAALTVVAVLFTSAARWAWAAAAGLVAAWTASLGGLAPGAVLLLAVVIATAVESPARPGAHGFNELVGRLGAVLVGVAGAVLVVIRVLQTDLTGELPVVLFFFMALTVGIYLLVERDLTEQVRAARLGVVLSASAWAAGGHPGAVVPVAAAAMILLTALVGPRRSPA
ncbi:MAG: hypothetical protein NVSMB17_16330 [Candidatus Dormibacteria bacterium]